MIRPLKTEDLPRVMQIWLDSNIEAHPFIAREYWAAHLDMVRGMLPLAEVYVYEQGGQIAAFVGIEAGYIAGIFVAAEQRSRGIGRLLLQRCKALYPTLSLSVYEKNQRAALFYLREGFSIKERRIEEATGEAELYMIWDGAAGG